MYQHKETGEYYMYRFFEVNSGKHYLVGPEGENVGVDTDDLQNLFIELDYSYGY